MLGTGRLRTNSLTVAQPTSSEKQIQHPGCYSRGSTEVDTRCARDVLRASQLEHRRDADRTGAPLVTGRALRGSAWTAMINAAERIVAE